MCMTFRYNPQINFCHFFHSLNLVIFGKWYPVHLLYTQCLIAGEIKTIGGGIRVPWTLFLVLIILLSLTNDFRFNTYNSFFSILLSYNLDLIG